MNSDVVANHCEGAIAARLSHITDGHITRFTPSVVSGRRYVGFEKDGRSYYIEVNVKDITDNDNYQLREES
jgi:hypothetical protein